MCDPVVWLGWLTLVLCWAGYMVLLVMPPVVAWLFKTGESAEVPHTYIHLLHRSMPWL